LTSGVEFDDSLVHHKETLRLWRLNKVVALMKERLGIDWVGIYRRVAVDSGEALVKEAYRGEPSRALFPLNEDYAKKSNNSWVGLNKTCKIIQDVTNYEGPYYECSKKVQSEFCAPIVTAQGELLGIIDAESWSRGFFARHTILEIFKVCHDLAAIRLGRE